MPSIWPGFRIDIGHITLCTWKQKSIINAIRFWFIATRPSISCRCRWIHPKNDGLTIDRIVNSKHELSKLKFSLIANATWNWVIVATVSVHVQYFNEIRTYTTYKIHISLSPETFRLCKAEKLRSKRSRSIGLSMGSCEVWLESKMTASVNGVVAAFVKVYQRC